MSQGMGPGPGMPASAGGSSIAFVQGGAWVTNSTSVTFTFGSNTASGNTIILITQGIPTLSDSQGLTFTQIQTYSDGNGGTLRVYCSSATSAAAESITGTATQATLVAAEFSGVGCTTDGSNSGSGVSTNPASGNITTANAADLLIGTFKPDRAISPAFSNTTGFTDVATSTSFGAFAYKIVSSTGTYNYTGNCGGSTCSGFFWGAGIVAVH